jgi:hypothetical protein
VNWNSEKAESKERCRASSSRDVTGSTSGPTARTRMLFTVDQTSDAEQGAWEECASPLICNLLLDGYTVKTLVACAAALST